MAGDTMSQVIVMQVEDFKRVVNESVRSAVREELKTISIAPEVMREKEAAKYLGLCQYPASVSCAGHWSGI